MHKKVETKWIQIERALATGSLGTLGKRPKNTTQNKMFAL